MRTRHNVTLYLHVQSLSCHDVSLRTVCLGGSVCIFMFLHSCAISAKKSNRMLVLRYFAHSGHCILCCLCICVPFSCFQQWVFSRGFLACFPLLSLSPVPSQACVWHSSICATCTLRLLCVFWFVPEYFPLSPIYVPSRKFCILLGIKQSLCRPGQAIRDPRSWGHPFSRQSAHEGVKIVSRTHQPPLPPRNYSWYSTLLVDEFTPGP